jgi:hypothetical protein
MNYIKNLGLCIQIIPTYTYKMVPTNTIPTKMLPTNKMIPIITIPIKTISTEMIPT